MAVERSSGLETIAALAEEIARSSPESANKAMQIAELARELDDNADVGTIRDVLEAETVDGDELSDTRARTAAIEIADALKR
jgi:hypothetical protein